MKRKSYTKPIILKAVVNKKPNNHCKSNDSEAGLCCWCKDKVEN